jgi:hypothetical protein
MRIIKFPKIEQFRAVVATVKHVARFEGVDANNELIYNDNELPTVSFEGTVKLHGTNSAICFNKSMNETWYQSREVIVTSGHFGFVNFFNNNKELVDMICDSVSDYLEIPANHDVAVYGEWCGPGVNKGTAIQKLPEKIFVVFGVMSIPMDSDDENDKIWYDHTYLMFGSSRVYNIYDFPTYNIQVDFNNAKDSVKLLEKITLDVENECPVAKQLTVSGIGEGVVWVGDYNGKPLRFKTKGDKHKSTKEKSLVAIEPEKLDSINRVLEYLVTESRYEQGKFETKAELHRKDTGKLIQWIAQDIEKEESDTLSANNLTWKDVSYRVTNAYRNMFFKEIDDNI